MDLKVIGYTLYSLFCQHKMKEPRGSLSLFDFIVLNKGKGRTNDSIRYAFNFFSCFSQLAGHLYDCCDHYLLYHEKAG